MGFLALRFGYQGFNKTNVVTRFFLIGEQYKRNTFKKLIYFSSNSVLKKGVNG